LAEDLSKRLPSILIWCDFACAALGVALFLRVAYTQSWNLVKITAVFETIAELWGKYASDERLQGVKKNLLIYHTQNSRIVANSDWFEVNVF
jgi:hypothetical protein